MKCLTCDGTGKTEIDPNLHPMALTGYYEQQWEDCDACGARGKSMSLRNVALAFDDLKFRIKYALGIIKEEDEIPY